MKILRILVPLALVVAGGVLGVTWWLGGDDAPNEAPPAAAAPSGDVAPRSAVAPPTTAEAEVAPRRTADVAFGVAGTVAARAVEVGDPVEAGDVLARLDDATQRARLAEAEAAVSAADAAVAAAREGVRAAETQRAVQTAAIRVAEAAREAADAGARLAAEQAPAQVARAEADARRAAAAVTQAEAGAAAAEVAVAQAEASLAVAEAQRRQARAALASAEVALAQRTVRAPFAGRVLTAPPEVGESVGPSAPTIRIGDVGGWRVVTTNLTERQVTGLTSGATVRVAIDAIPGRTFDGTVERVAYAPRLVRGDVTYEATIRVDGAASDADVAARLRPGMTAVVRDLPLATGVPTGR